MNNNIQLAGQEGWRIILNKFLKGEDNMKIIATEDYRRGNFTTKYHMVF